MRWKGLSALAFAVCSAAGSTACVPLGDESRPAARSATVMVSPSPVPVFSSEGVVTEWIEVGDLWLQVPEGIRLPDDILIASATEAAVTIAEADPGLILDAVTASAETSGYEVVADPRAGCRLWVGHGNAVLLDATEGAQILSWGPESMKDVLSTG